MSKTKVEFVDAATVEAKAPTKRKKKSQIQKAEEVNHRDKLAPVPKEAYDNPVKWAEEHVTTLVPQAVKEVEYALKFGTNIQRLNIGLEILAMKGISSKQQQPVNQVPAINLTITSLPFQQQETKQLEAQTIDAIPEAKFK